MWDHHPKKEWVHTNEWENIRLKHKSTHKWCIIASRAREIFMWDNNKSQITLFLLCFHRPQLYSLLALFACKSPKTSRRGSMSFFYCTISCFSMRFSQFAHYVSQSVLFNSINCAIRHRRFHVAFNLTCLYENGNKR